MIIELSPCPPNWMGCHLISGCIDDHCERFNMQPADLNPRDCYDVVDRFREMMAGEIMCLGHVVVEMERELKDRSPVFGDRLNGNQVAASVVFLHAFLNLEELLASWVVELCANQL